MERTKKIITAETRAKLKRIGVSETAYRQRLQNGWTKKDAVSRPPQKTNTALKRGKYGTKVNVAWSGMCQRAANGTEQYKKRGIYKPWLGNFLLFYNHIGDPPTEKHELDRINNNIGYFPGNVRWVTRKRNRRNMYYHLYISWKGKRQCIADWSDELGISQKVLSERRRRGWPVEDIMTTKVGKTKERYHAYKNRLKPEDVLSIKTGNESNKELAKKYGVHRTTISMIRRGKMYKYINRGTHAQRN